MRIRSLLFALALAWLIVDSAVARADEPALVDPFLKAAQLAEEVPAGEAFADGSNFDSTLDCTDPVECGDEVGLAGLIEPTPSRRSRWIVLTELTTLFPSYSTTTIATANDEPIFGPRISLGWESAAGFGVRGRGWGFDTAVDAEGSPISAPSYHYYYDYAAPLQVTSHEINFRGGRFDLDLYKRFEHSTGYVTIGASLTAAELTLRENYTATQNGYYYQTIYNFPYSYNYQVHYTTTYQGEGIARNRGGGLGLLVEGTHCFYETPLHEWSIFSRGRVAYLIGQWEASYASALTEGDGNMLLGEAALGLEYRLKLRRADLVAQCSFEVQTWNVSIADRVNFAGVTNGVGIEW